MALEELNSEYIALKRGAASKDDLSALLATLRTRYSDIRAKVSHQPASRRRDSDSRVLVFTRLFVFAL